jgi:hypothetical protein
VHVDHAAVRTIKIGDQKKGDGYDDRQDEQEELPFATLAIADEEVTGDCHQDHRRPCADGYPVPPGSRRVALRIEHIVHAGDRKRRRRGGVAGRCRAHHNPERVLYTCRLLSNFRGDARVAFFIEGNAQIEIFPQQFARARTCVPRQQIGTQILRADGVGFGLLQGLALVVAANRH